MTIEDVRAKMLDLTQAIREYKDGKDYDSDELEILVDDMLCRLPRDVFYIEWFDRSQIRDMVIDRIEYTNQETEITDSLIDECMHDLWTNDDSYMQNDDICWTIADTINEHKGGIKMSIANIILDQEQRYLDAKYNLVCCIIQEFFEYYDKAMTPDYDELNAFMCEQSKEIDNIIKDFENNKE